MSKRRQRRAAAEPTEKQLFEACLAFHTLQVRYRCRHDPKAPVLLRHLVIVMSEDGDSETIHRFVSADAADRWRTHEIIRETIKVAMRTKP